jgi:ubiquinone/menaquinone biosynthesis C-methylase UbiE
MQQPSFNDHFSTLASTYARHRPRYPDALFAYLAKISPSNALAWDCATGNGQAAQNLASHFKRVIATDASSAQIQAAEAASNVEYRVAPAESSGLEAASIDLCTVAQAIHWFNFEKFYAEVRRVLKPQGIFAIWTYTHSEISPAIDGVMHNFYKEIRDYFPPERQWVDEKYATLPFPFEEIAPLPQFVMEAAWNLEDVLGYYRSWSGVKAFRERHGKSPLGGVESRLREVWEEPNHVRPVHWKLHLRVGKIPSE